MKSFLVNLSIPFVNLNHPVEHIKTILHLQLHYHINKKKSKRCNISTTMYVLYLLKSEINEESAYYKLS